MFSDYSLTHVTWEYFVEITVHEVFLLFEDFMTFPSALWFECPIFFTVMCCGSDKEIPLEGLKIFLIFESGVM